MESGRLLIQDSGGCSLEVLPPRPLPARRSLAAPGPCRGGVGPTPRGRGGRGTWRGTEPKVGSKLNHGTMGLIHVSMYQGSHFGYKSLTHCHLKVGA